MKILRGRSVGKPLKRFSKEKLRLCTRLKPGENEMKP